MPKNIRNNNFYRLLGFALIATVISPLYYTAVCADPIFIDITESAGLTFEHTDGRSGLRLFNEFLGSGGGFFDYDGDGDLDIYLVNGAPQTDNVQDKTPHNALYRNNGDATFTDVTKVAGVGSTAYGTGATVGDYDNDGDLDLYVTNFGTDQLYQNNGNGTFTDVTTHAKVGNPNWGTSCAFADVDNDGHLDLYIANYAEYTPEKDIRCEERGVHVYCGPHAYPAVHDTFYKNNGDGTFTEASTLYRPADLIPQHGLGVTFGDYDADGNIDLYVANDQDPNFLFQNSGTGNFLEVALISGVCYNDMGKEEAGMGTDFGDYDNDGKLDLTVSNYQTETNTVYRNHDSTFFTDNTITSGIAEVTHGYLGWGIRFFDYDNDGHQDIFVANGHLMDNINVLEKHVTYPQRNLLFRNLGDGTFANVTSAETRHHDERERAASVETDGLALKKVSRGAAIGDYDNDGDLDILVTNCNQRPDLLQNAVGNRNNWIQVQVVGQKSNRSGIGARIKVVTGTHVQYREVQSGGSYLSFHDLRAHFGVGKAEQIDLLEIRWTNGHIDRGTLLPVNQRFIAVESEKIVPID
ncbi:CRTAC1 family protein [Candidatus Poribacteria bacterium]|nr:CRTAC1 family protein [Candidatus Poribacteria bacterium]MYK20788.1 CRTAC1 family protein [Candidatus Poribacteria bacterium]